MAQEERIPRLTKTELVIYRSTPVQCAVGMQSVTETDATATLAE